MVPSCLACTAPSWVAGMAPSAAAPASKDSSSVCALSTKTGGKPLQLKALSLDYDQVLGAPGPDHDLRALTNWSCLRDLHVLDRRAIDTLGAAYEAFDIIRPVHLPNLRKLSWPGWKGLTIKLLALRLEE